MTLDNPLMQILKPVLPQWSPKHNMSGTVVVSRTAVEPHYYVHADEGYGYRATVADDLCLWLNTGNAPKWSTEIHLSPDGTCVLGPRNIQISAAGPMVLPNGDDGRLAWMPDPSPRALEQRNKLLMFLLGNASRP